MDSSQLALIVPLACFTNPARPGTNIETSLVNCPNGTGQSITAQESKFNDKGGTHEKLDLNNAISWPELYSSFNTPKVEMRDHRRIQQLMLSIKIGF